MKAPDRRQLVLSQLQEEFTVLRLLSPEQLALDSDFVRQNQVDKTQERIEVVRGLRAWSLAESTQHRFGTNLVPVETFSAAAWASLMLLIRADSKKEILENQAWRKKSAQAGYVPYVR